MDAFSSFIKYGCFYYKESIVCLSTIHHRVTKWFERQRYLPAFNE